MKVLVAGGQGFVGSQLVRTLLQNGHTVMNLDKHTYAAHPANLLEVESSPQYAAVVADIADASGIHDILRTFRPDAVINSAAETHVDRSIRSASSFLTSNVMGVQVLLDVCRELDISPLVQLSTDEVMGPTPSGTWFDESAPLAPSSPYAASKACAELIIRAAVQTHGLDVRVIRSSNNYGPRQYPEKLIPLAILRALENQRIPLYGDGRQVRDWMHVEDHAEAVLTVLMKGEKGAIYCAGARAEYTNRQIVESILSILGKPFELIETVRDRPGHDRRYALDPSRLHCLGWQAQMPFDRGLRQTVRWYLSNRSWLEAVRGGAYQDFHTSWNRAQAVGLE